MAWVIRVAVVGALWCLAAMATTFAPGAPYLPQAALTVSFLAIFVVLFPVLRATLRWLHRQEGAGWPAIARQQLEARYRPGGWWLPLRGSGRPTGPAAATGRLAGVRPQGAGRPVRGRGQRAPEEYELPGRAGRPGRTGRPVRGQQGRTSAGRGPADTSPGLAAGMRSLLAHLPPPQRVLAAVGFGAATVVAVTAFLAHPAGPLAGAAPGTSRQMTYHEFRHIEALGQRGFAASAAMAYVAAAALGAAVRTAERADDQ